MKAFLLSAFLLSLGCLPVGAQPLAQAPLDARVFQQTLLVLASANPEERALAVRSLETLGVGSSGPVVYRVLQAYGNGTLYLWNQQVVLTDAVTQDENYVKQINPIDAITGEYKVSAQHRVKLKEVQVLAADRLDRELVADSLLFLALGLDSRSAVLGAIPRISAIDRAPEAVPALENLARSPDQGIRFAAEESLALIRLKAATDEAAQLTQIRKLGELTSLRALPVLRERSTTATEPALGELKSAIVKIQEYEAWVNAFDILKSSLSTGSILILMAMGLAITFGMMGVINMAHGEMMMIGAYTTYCVQLLFGHTADRPAPEFFLVALPLSFLVAALVGGLIEGLVVRHLYKKPIESLLATYGVSLILTQVIRLTFGDNRATNSPDWLQGAVGVAQGMDIPANRLFILAVAVLCVLLVVFLFRYTRMGLRMKATMQNRDMAAAMGINTRSIDRFTFMLGSGLAGVAGYALTTVGGITPDMGKNYIVDSFLIVVTGGVGSVAGVVVSGAGIGFLNKFLEGTILGTVWAKIAVLALVMTFIQFKPSGIFAPKGRLADD